MRPLSLLSTYLCFLLVVGCRQAGFCQRQPIQTTGSAAAFVQLAAGANHSLGLQADGSLWAWGANDEGQLGDQTLLDRWTPVRVLTPGTSPSRWLQVSAGGAFSIALRTDHTLWAWGANGDGQLGTAQAYFSTEPVEVDTPADAEPGTSWTHVVAGCRHVLALRSDGSLWAWGFNASGQLGDGTRQSRSRPQRVRFPAEAAGSTWVSLAAQHHSAAVGLDGRLWVWGDNSSWQLGDGTSRDRVVPQLVGAPMGAAAGTSWTQVSLGTGHTLALRSDATLWSWGSNFRGMQGDETTTLRPYPGPVAAPATPVAAGTRWQRIATGYQHSWALRSDSTLWGWGYNLFGALGDSTLTAVRLRPQQEYSQSSWSQVVGGGLHSLALRQGQAYGTGAYFTPAYLGGYYKYRGELGNGTGQGDLIFRPRQGGAPVASLGATPQAQVYPNPVVGQLQLRQVPADATLRLYTLQGTCVRSWAAGPPAVDLSGVLAGVYLLTIQAPSHSQQVVRLVVP
jgi:alpha-tubulin suppressor-like RCC1 family protein